MILKTFQVLLIIGKEQQCFGRLIQKVGLDQEKLCSTTHIQVKE